MKSHIGLYFIVVIVLLFGCSSSKKNIKQQNATPLLGTYWVLQSIEGKKIDTAHLIVVPHIVFDTAGQYHGNFGCNIFLGEYYAGKKKIFMSYMGASKRLCSNMEMEKQFYSAIKQEIKHYNIENNTLILSTKEREILRFSGNSNADLAE